MKIGQYIAVVVVFLGCFPLPAQEKSVNPGINKSFQDPKVAEFEQRFEKEGREVYDKRQAVIEELGLEPGMAVADVGAGTGLYTRLLAPAVGKQGKVYAVDIAKSFVEHAVKSSEEQGWHNVEGIVCASDDAGLPPGSVDLVFICDTYHHFEFPSKTMASIRKALRPGGKLVVIDFERIEGKSREWLLEHVRAGKPEVIKEIQADGFELAGEVPMFKENYFLVFKVADIKG